MPNGETKRTHNSPPKRTVNVVVDNNYCRLSCISPNSYFEYKGELYFIIGLENGILNAAKLSEPGYAGFTTFDPTTMVYHIKDENITISYKK